jgi:hypothetical protein
MHMTPLRSHCSTSGLLVVAAMLMVLLLAACGSPAGPTTTAPTTAPTAAPTLAPSPTSPTYIAAGKKWSGQANQYNYGTYPMIWILTTLQGSKFSGNINWPSFNTTTKMNGTIVTNFGDVAEQQLWHYVPGFDKHAVGTYIKFTETDYAEGSGVELNDVYYALVQPNGAFQGVWFKPNETQPSGDYLIQPQTTAT